MEKSQLNLLLDHLKQFLKLKKSAFEKTKSRSKKLKAEKKIPAKSSNPKSTFPLVRLWQSGLTQLQKSPKRILSLIVLIILLAGIVLNLLTNYSLSANFADSVMRPLIGSQNTVFLESIVFNTEDLVNRLIYKVVPVKDQSVSDFTSQPLSPLPVATSSAEMQLTPLNVSQTDKNPLKGEGEWIPISLSLNQTEPLMAKTFVRPDPERPFAVVSIVEANMKKLKLSAVAGTVEPGGMFGNKGPGKVPSEIQDKNLLVAAFNGGFQERDGQYGMVVGNKTYLPLKPGLATLVIDKDSNLKIVNYEGQKFGSDVVVIRQNGNLLVQNSQIIPLPTDNQYGVWGRTVTNSMYTWRSGIGITKDGNLLYAVGPSLIPSTLAQALVEAGAVDAMQLDINPYWVRFDIFNSLGNGQYSHSPLLKDMYDGGEQFLHGYQKDFFYLYRK